MSPLSAEGLLALDGCWVKEIHFSINFNREKRPDVECPRENSGVTGVNMTKMHHKGKRKKTV